MIAKELKENQRVFDKFYFQLCMGQNISPVANIKKRLADKVLDFVGDGLKLHDWQLLLKALRTDRSLKTIAIRSRHLWQTVLEDIDTEGKAQKLLKVPILFTKYMVQRIVDVCCRCIKHSQELTSVVIERIPLDKDSVSQIAQAIQQSKALKELALPYCRITDEGCQILCSVLRSKVTTLRTLDLTGCDITYVGTTYLSEVLQKQKLIHLEECWKQSLRYNVCDPEEMHGLRRLTLNCNPLIGDYSLKLFCSALMDDYWLRALDVQACGLTEDCLKDVLDLVIQNETLQILDVRANDIGPDAVSSIIDLQEEKISSSKIKYHWLKEVPSNNWLFPPASSSNRNLSSKPVHSSTTVHTNNVYTVQKPKKDNNSRRIQSDITLCSTKSRVFNSQAKHIKSCDTVRQSNNRNTGLAKKFSHHFQLSHSTSNKNSCPPPLVRQRVSNTCLTDKVSHHSQLSSSTTDKDCLPSHQDCVGGNRLATSSEKLPEDKHTNKGAKSGSKIKTRITVRLGEYGVTERHTVCSPPAVDALCLGEFGVTERHTICSPPAVDAFQKLLMAEA